MTIQQFIEKAIEGGWKEKYTGVICRCSLHPDGVKVHNNALFLDPEAWKAVGKVEGWDKDRCDGHCRNICRVHLGEFQWCDNPGCRCHSGKQTHWKVEMHRMIDALAEGKTIEQYLETL